MSRKKCPKCGSDRVYREKTAKGKKKDTYYCANCNTNEISWYQLIGNISDKLLYSDQKSLDEIS